MSEETLELRYWEEDGGIKVLAAFEGPKAAFDKVHSERLYDFQGKFEAGPRGFADHLRNVQEIKPLYEQRFNKNGDLHGLQKTWHACGTVMIAEYEHGEASGERMEHNFIELVICDVPSEACCENQEDLPLFSAGF